MKSSKSSELSLLMVFGCFWPSFDWMLVKVAPTAVDMAQCDAFLTLPSTTDWHGVARNWNRLKSIGEVGSMVFVQGNLKCRPVGPLFCTGKDNRISAYISMKSVTLIIPGTCASALRQFWLFAYLLELIDCWWGSGFYFCWTCTRAWFTWYSTYSTTHVPHILLLLFLCKLI